MVKAVTETVSEEKSDIEEELDVEEKNTEETENNKDAEIDMMAYELKAARKEVKILKKMNEKGGLGEAEVAATELKVKKYIKHTIFRKCKFIGDMKMLDSIGKKLMDYMTIEPNQREAFWVTYKHTVLRALTQQRNVAIQAMKEKWYGK